MSERPDTTQTKSKMTAAKRKIHIEGDVAFVTLTRGYTAIIDAADVPLVEGYNWTSMVTKCASGDVRAVYAVRTQLSESGKKRAVLMHRVIADTPDGMETDHVDGNGLDNRRCNLRLATTAQNRCNKRTASNNTSGFKGVSWHKRDQKWQAGIRVEGKRYNLGYFDCPEKAAKAYAQASANFHAQFGRTM